MTTHSERFAPFIRQGLISARQHQSEPLTIYNYTKQCQYQKAWTPETLMARGLIVNHETDTVVARPFKKFFNLGEMPDDWTPPSKHFQVTFKMDGSLGILYPTKHGYAIATRGSFTSEQAFHATEVFNERYAHLDWRIFVPEFTFLFEVIYPENRVVVDYGKEDDLVLLAVLDTHTGRDVGMPSFFPNKVHIFGEEANSLERLSTFKQANIEGFVVRFFDPDNTRIKIKTEEYVRLHRLLTGVTARRIWEMIGANEDIDKLLKNVPEEFADWIKGTVASLKQHHATLLKLAFDTYLEVKHLSRKDAALALDGSAVRSLVFRLMDGKPIDEAIHKMIRPAHEVPFKEDIDA